MTYALKGNLAGITPERAERMAIIIKALRKEKLSVLEISKATNMTKSGGRKYIMDMVRNEIIHADGFAARGGRGIKRPLYSLTKDEDLLEWFLVEIMAPGDDGLPRSRGQKATARIHMVKDDEVFKVKPAPLKPPKQFDLLLYLFGMAPAEGLLS